MTTKKRVTIEVEVEETDRLFDTEQFRLELAQHIQYDYVVAQPMYGEPEARITAIRVDGIRFDPATYDFEPGPITAEIAAEIMAGRKIVAIKMVRENTACSLMEAKEAVDKYAANR